jgi:5-methyltetrahydropteroyltriglutamate--homocysteine methyltransferase
MVAKPPFKADVVGSLLRPDAIQAARQGRERGAVPAEALWEIEVWGTA